MRVLRIVFIAGFLFAAPLAAQATTSVCADRSISAAVGRGACSGHGGLDAKASAAHANASAAKAAKTAENGLDKAAERANEKSARSAKEMAEIRAAHMKSSAASAANATNSAEAAFKATRTVVSCRDGSMSAGGPGACSRHGGIAETRSYRRP